MYIYILKLSHKDTLSYTFIIQYNQKIQSKIYTKVLNQINN